MKHRSISIFVIFAAMIAAVPQASQQIQDAGGALGERVRFEILNALAGLQARERGWEVSPRRLEQALASSQDNGQATLHAALPAKKSRSGNDFNANVPVEIAETLREPSDMLVDPSTGSVPPQLATEHEARFSNVVYQISPEMLAKGDDLAREPAMIIPPGVDNGVPPAVARSLREVDSIKAKTRELRNLGPDKHAAVEAARLTTARMKGVLTSDEIRIQLDALSQPDMPAPPAGATFLKLHKMRRVNRPAPAAPAPAPHGKASCPTKQVVVAEFAAPAISVETFAAGE